MVRSGRSIVGKEGLGGKSEKIPDGLDYSREQESEVCSSLFERVTTVD